jgi:Glycosyltransferase
MKVFFVTDTMHPGGSERVISVLANHFAQRGINTTILCYRRNESFYEIDEKVSVCYLEKETNGASLLKRGKWLRSYCIRECPDVVIPFMTAVYCLTLFSLLGSGIPVICSERIDPRTTSVKRKALRALLLPFARHLVVQTESIKSYYGKTIQKKCSVIYNPVDPSFFLDAPNVYLKRIINVGRLSPQKNQKLLIDAFSDICNEYPEYKLSIYGEGELKQELLDYIDGMGLNDSVFLEGTSNHIAEELNRSAVFCLSSDFEGMSNAVIEAICAGVPIISTDVSGIRELIVPDVNGIIIKRGDRGELATALKRVLSDHSLADRMRLENREKGRCLFNTESIVDQWMSLVKRVI